MTLSGLLTFDLMAGAAVAALVFVEKRGTPKETPTWLFLLSVVGVFLLLRAMGAPQLARAAALVGVAAWIPLFMQTGRERGFGARVWQCVAGIAAACLGRLRSVGSPRRLDHPLAPARAGLAALAGRLRHGGARAGLPGRGKLLGEKLILTEFGAYLDLANQLAASARGEVPMLDPRSLVIVSYALCGFANVASIGIQIGGIAPLAPNRRQEIARLGFKAMVGGALATFMIACVAGVFYSGRSMLGLTRSRGRRSPR